MTAGSRHGFKESGINDAGTDTDPYEETTPENILAWIEANPK
jgi:hypothetical protein